MLTPFQRLNSDLATLRAKAVQEEGVLNALRKDIEQHEASLAAIASGAGLPLATYQTYATAGSRYI